MPPPHLRSLLWRVAPATPVREPLPILRRLPDGHHGHCAGNRSDQPDGSAEATSGRGETLSPERRWDLVPVGLRNGNLGNSLERKNIGALGRGINRTPDDSLSDTAVVPGTPSGSQERTLVDRLPRGTDCDPLRNRQDWLLSDARQGADDRSGTLCSDNLPHRVGITTRKGFP